MSNFINDYLFFNEGNEADRQYHLWSALALISTVIGRRVWFAEEGDRTYSQLRFFPNIYVCLVGVQGNGKSFAKDGVRKILAKEFPEIPRSPSVDTVPALTKFMGSTNCRRTFSDGNGKLFEYTPMMLIVNELKNFLQVNPAGMVDFLVDIYDCDDKYDVRTKHQGEDDILAPNVVFLGCATTEFIVDQLRDRVLSGGLSRRVIFVNVIKERVRKEYNRIPEGGQEALDRAIAHLHKIKDLYGPFAWASVEDRAYFLKWYLNPKIPDDPLLAGFVRTMPTQVRKIAMLLALAEYQPKLLITKQHVGHAILYLNDLLPNMERLFAGAGRNTLSIPMQRIIDLLEANAGMMPEKELRKIAGKDLQPFELASVMEHLRTTDQVVYGKMKDAKGVERLMCLTKKKADELGNQ